MQFKLKENSTENKAFCAFSEDSSILIVVNQEGNYYEIEIAKGEQKCRRQ